LFGKVLPGLFGGGVLHHLVSPTSQFQVSTLQDIPLEVETGRYRTPKTPLQQRVCQLCENGVGDETHFLNHCKPMLSHHVRCWGEILSPSMCSIAVVACGPSALSTFSSSWDLKDALL